MTQRILHILSAVFFLAIFSSCEELDSLSPELTKEQVVLGLKTALEIGTDSSTAALSLKDGFYKNALLKIPLPDEAENVRSQLNSLLSKASVLQNFIDVDKEFENVIKSINRAAEEASKEAKPIFVDAISGMSLAEGWDILNGVNPKQELKSSSFDSTAATGYFKSVTFAPLTGLFSPKIDVQLDKDLGLGFSANQAWSTLRNVINNTVNTLETKAAYENSGITINRISQESIGQFATEKALSGLFYKVGEEEKKIRKNPFIWASDIIEKVFGSIFSEKK